MRNAGSSGQPSENGLLQDAAAAYAFASARYGAERIVVKLDIAADIRIDAGGQIVQGLACQRHVAAAHVEHDVAADGGEADHRERGAGDQQSC